MGHPGARSADRRRAQRRHDQAVELDATCLAFTLVVSTLTALAFGLIPAAQAGSAEPAGHLGRQSRGGTADRAQHACAARSSIAEVALAVVLIVGAGLLLRRSASLVRVDLGFRPAQTITMRLFLGVRDDGLPGAPRGRDPPARRSRARREGRRNHPVPAACGHDLRIGILACRPADCRSHGLTTECSLVSRGYFAAIGIPVVAGPRVRCRDTASAGRRGDRQPRVRPTLLSGGRVLGRHIRVHAADRPPRRSSVSSATSGTAA